MLFFSGCYSDSFLDAMKSEIDFISPFDVTITTEESKRTTYFPITDTGSTINIIGVSGDDGEYNNMTQPDSSNFEEQDVGGDYIVIDHKTGLTWTKCTAYQIDPDSIPDNGDEYYAMDNTSGCTNIAKSMEWSKAAETCKNLDYAGRKDWRLPRLPELLTIVNYGFHPAFDPALFPNTRGDIEVLEYTKNHYSIDDRTRFIKETNGTYTAVLPGAVNYTMAKYIYEDGLYVFNEDYKDLFKLDNAGPYIRVFVLLADFDVNNRYRYDSGSYISDPSGIYYKAGINYIPFGDLYAYDPIWGFKFNINSTPKVYVRVYITDSEDHFTLSGADYSPGSGPYVRVYTPNIKAEWVWSAFLGDHIPITGPYTDARAKYLFNGLKYVRDDVNGNFIQNFDTPLGYWTYSSKLMFDNSMNTADHAWVVFFQNGGPLGVNMATYLLKTKEDLTFEKQFVRCVCGGNGDLDDVNY